MTSTRKRKRSFSAHNSGGQRRPHRTLRGRTLKTGRGCGNGLVRHLRCYCFCVEIFVGCRIRGSNERCKCLPGYLLDDLWYHTNHAAWLKILSFNSRRIFWTLYFLSKLCVRLLQPPWKFHSKTVFAKQFSIMITPPNQKKQNNEIFSVFLVLPSQY